jgi:DNA-binding MarR family transcriptional regulator
MRKTAISAAIGAVILGAVWAPLASATGGHQQPVFTLAQADTAAPQARENIRERAQDKAANLTDEQRQKFKGASPDDKKDFLQNQQEKRNKLLESMTPEERQKFRDADPDAQADYMQNARPERPSEGPGGRLTEEQRARLQEMSPEERHTFMREQRQGGNAMERMSDAQRQRFEAATPEQREKFMSNMNNPEGRKQKMMERMSADERAQFKQMSPQEQRQFLQSKFQQHRTGQGQNSQTPQ